MGLSLGVDTGGTYTDAVILRDETEVIASAKALTTRHDLAEGILASVTRALADGAIDPRDITLASLSTTLATNALVENQGGRVGLILAGFRDTDLDRHGLRAALGTDPALGVAGGHTHAGDEAAPLDLEHAARWVDDIGDTVTGFAVAAQFATRNPAHEVALAEMLRDKTRLPVSLSHHLSSKLNGPKRALTAVLNARLIGMIDRLITRMQDSLHRLDIRAPVMVVRGDGALISAAQARARPIETILSGPAASLVGAAWLCGESDALVSDIGGTTTDVAVMRAGRPVIDPEGAAVGGHKTMVEAVAMRTTGLGGDSEVHLQTEGLSGGIFLGPSRVVPISLLAQEAPDLVHKTLRAQLASPLPRDSDGRFVRRVVGVPAHGLAPREAALFERIAEAPRALADVVHNRLDLAGMAVLRARGLVQIAAASPSDASHVANLTDQWDREAAHMAMALLARRRAGHGRCFARCAEEMADLIIKQLRDQTANAILQAAFANETNGFEGAPETMVAHELTQRALDGHSGLVRLQIGVDVPVIGLGASAAVYYPPVGARLGTRMVLPQHAGVANAIGAVVGRVRIRKTATITAPNPGVFRSLGAGAPVDYSDVDVAISDVIEILRRAAQDDAADAGAVDVHVHPEVDITTAEVEGQESFIEASVSVEATGRPRIAD